VAICPAGNGNPSQPRLLRACMRARGSWRMFRMEWRVAWSSMAGIGLGCSPPAILCDSSVTETDYHRHRGAFRDDGSGGWIPPRVERIRPLEQIEKPTLSRGGVGLRAGFCGLGGLGGGSDTSARGEAGKRDRASLGIPKRWRVSPWRTGVPTADGVSPTAGGWRRWIVMMQPTGTGRVAPFSHNSDGSTRQKVPKTNKRGARVPHPP